MFKRRTSPGLLRRLRELLWPSMGWRRAFDYYRHRVFRTGDSAWRITAGLATGVAVSFTPFLGTHFIQAALFSWLLRASVLSGLIGTIAGNPWTFPFMLWLEYKTGVWLCGLTGLSAFAALPGPADLAPYQDHILPFVSFMIDHPVRLLLPLTAGGYLCAVLCWPVAYLLLYHPVRAAHAAYCLRRSARKKTENSNDHRDR